MIENPAHIPICTDLHPHKALLSGDSPLTHDQASSEDRDGDHHAGSLGDSNKFMAERVVMCRDAGSHEGWRRKSQPEEKPSH